MQYCLLDMDGVIADFLGGACKLHGKQIDYRIYRDDVPLNEMWLMSNNKFWQPINWEFWANLERLPDANKIVKLLENAFNDHVYICSSPSLGEDAEMGKKKWLKKHFPQFLRNNRFVFTGAKFLLANKYNLLIDDTLKNVIAFQNHGGHALLLPRIHNSRFEENPISVLEQALVKLNS